MVRELCVCALCLYDCPWMGYMHVGVFNPCVCWCMCECVDCANVPVRVRTCGGHMDNLDKRRAYILCMQSTCTHTCSYMYGCTGEHHKTRPEGIIRPYHEAYNVELIRGPAAPPENPVRDQDQSAFSQADFSVKEGFKKISPSKMTRAAPPPPAQTISNESEKTVDQEKLRLESEKTVEEAKLRLLLDSSPLASQEFEALLRAISSLVPDLESPTTAQEATTFVLQVAECMCHLYVGTGETCVFVCARSFATVYLH
jgi:hypothetical protein